MSNPHPTPFQKTGASANPNGRPKRAWTVQSLIEEAMEEEDETGVPYKKTVYKNLVKIAKRGDIQAIRELNNRLDGMSQQKMDVTSAGQPLQVKVTEDTTLKEANE